MPPGASAVRIREILAAATGQALFLARAWGRGEVELEKSLGKLRSAMRNRLLNHWAQCVLGTVLTRRARLTGIAIRDGLMRILRHHRQQGLCGADAFAAGPRSRGGVWPPRGGSRTSCRPARTMSYPAYGRIGVGPQRR